MQKVLRNITIACNIEKNERKKGCLPLFCMQGRRANVFDETPVGRKETR